MSEERPPAQPAVDPPKGSTAPAGRATTQGAQRPTRISAAWIATIVVLVLLVLLLVFILQNLRRVPIHVFAWSPVMPLGVAMLLSAVVGGAVVGITGAARLVQLSRARKRHRPLQ